MAAEPAPLRLDKFLWCARIARSREACGALIIEGAVRINRQITDKPHARVRIGDVISIRLRSQIRVWRVLKLPDRRGTATEAQSLYAEIPDPASCIDDTSYPTQDFSSPGDQQ